MKPKVSIEFVTPYGEYVEVCIWGGQLKNETKKENAL
jgi:hypothetical protein